MWPDSTPGAVVWDLDGTLVDSAPDLAHALNDLLRRSGRAELSLQAVRGMIGGGAPLLVERGFSATGSALEPETLVDAVDQFLQIYRNVATQQTRLRDGVLGVVESFRAAGIKQAVCTNKPEDISRDILEHVELAEVFEFIAGGDTTENKKPEPDSLLLCLCHMNIEPAQAVMIGDSGADVSAARAAGTPIILIRGGYTRVPVESLGSDHVVRSFNALGKAILDPAENVLCA